MIRGPIRSNNQILLAIILLVILASRPAFTQNIPQFAAVTGWKSVPSHIMTYNREGDETGYADLTGRMVSGKREWRADLDIIDVGGGIWVDSDALALTYCPKVATSPIRGRAGTTMAGVYGSGNGC